MMRQWPVNIQQDAHEFFLWILNKLHQEQQLHAGDTAVEETVYGELSSLYSCTRCADSFQTSERFLDIASPLTSNTLLLEPSDEMSDRPCRNCQTSPTMCNTEIVQCPPVLAVMLTRFNNRMQKLQGKCRLQEQITTKLNVDYKLTAVINHTGQTPATGHYTVLIRDDHLNQWFKCDDDRITRCTLPAQSTLAYVLIYSRL